MHKRAVFIALIVLTLTTIPYLFAARTAGSAYVFGGFLYNPIDGNSYLAKMHQGLQGEWRFILPYSARPGDGAYINLFYIFLGHLARIFGLTLPLTFHLARIIAAICLLYALYRFLRAYQLSPRWADLLYALATLGLGMGWLVFPFGFITADFLVPEAYPFLSVFANPHFALGLALLLYLLILPGWMDGSKSASPGFLKEWTYGAAALGLAIVSPFGVVIALVVLAGLLAWELGVIIKREGGGIKNVEEWWNGKLALLTRDRLSKALNRLGWVMIGGLPLLFYYLWVAHSDPVLALWNFQNQTPKPPLWDMVISLSPALIVALPGVWLIWQRKIAASLFLTWTLLAMLLLYLPINLQRRFMMGIFVPVVGLAGYGLEQLWERIGRRTNLLATITLALSLPSTLLILIIAFYGIQTRDPMLYLTSNEAQAFDWIEGHTSPRALILAAPETGMYIPAHTGRRVIYGHPFETVNAEEEEAAVNRFFRGNGDVSVDEFLRVRGVNYVFYGPRERELGPPPFGDFLQSVFSNDGVVIYQVAGALVAR